LTDLYHFISMFYLFAPGAVGYEIGLGFPESILILKIIISLIFFGYSWKESNVVHSKKKQAKS